MKGTLSDYWAQELIGSDLLREELKATPPPERKNWIAVFDSPGMNHSTHVKNLISNEGPHAVLPELRSKKILLVVTDKFKGYEHTLSLFETGFPGDYISEADYMKKSPPHFINNSMDWWEGKDIYDAFKKLSPPAVVVTASGNDFPMRIDSMKSKASQDFDSILVGSLSPKGFASDFSQFGEEVHMMAPSDHWIASAGQNGEHEKFGGTSGAVPLVTGSLAGFEWLSGYHPTSKEAKILLEKTSFPTLHSHESPQLNGAGMLNAYKMGEVGKRLKKKCKGKGRFCFTREILNEDNYRFDLEKRDKDLKRDLKKAFPLCAGGVQNSLESSDCKEKGEVFKRLRRAALLNPGESGEFLKSLSCIYREGGFSQNAEALDNLFLSLGSREEVRVSVKALAKKEEPISREMLRLMMGMGGFEEFRFFEDERAIKIAEGMGKSGLPLVEKAFATGDPDLQRMAVWEVDRIGESGLPLLEKAFATDDPDLQEEAVRAAGWEADLPLLKRILNNKNLSSEVRRKISRF